MITRKCAIGLLAAVLFVCSAWAEVGSVISSFIASAAGGPFDYGVYRDPAYVYCLRDLGRMEPPFYSLAIYTPTGSMVKDIGLNYMLEFRDADGCHLGASYFAVAGGTAYELYIMNKNTGSIVRTLRVEGPGGTVPMVVAWDGRYYHVSGENCRGQFRRYTSSGSFAGTWVAAGWPAGMDWTGAVAFAHRVRGKAGNYLVANSGGKGCVINIDNGSCLATWAGPGGLDEGSVYGDSSRPTTFGAAYWLSLNRWVGSKTEGWVYEIDLGGRGGHAVFPASAGKIKAIYQ